MRVRLLLGPAGSGKTVRCLEEIKQALAEAPEGAPLLLVAPKQTTYQLERQLLSDPSLPGYTRLQILSFERLARLGFALAGGAEPVMLDEEGRLMVLRGLLAKKRQELKLFRATARLTGFAQQLSLVLRELQHNQLTPQELERLAGSLGEPSALAGKLHDLASLLRDYLRWLKEHRLEDADSLFPAAVNALAQLSNTRRRPRLQGLWVDGFAEFSQQEVALLAAVMPLCQAATVTFCLDGEPATNGSWASTWALARKNFQRCRRAFAGQPDIEIVVESLERAPARTRFVPALQHLERVWAEVEPGRAMPEIITEGPAGGLQSHVRLAPCAAPEGEAVMAARELLRFERAGGRWREAAVLVRDLRSYHQLLQRVFNRYKIPFFLDRRESVCHHPVAELTRSALRTVSFQWQSEDWFAALKTGLVPVPEEEIDRLENEALAHGWRGESWRNGLVVKGAPALTEWLGKLEHQLLPPFQRLALTLEQCKYRPSGPKLAAAILALWTELDVEAQLERWAAGSSESDRFQLPASVHATVWEQMQSWVENLELGFPDEALPMREWLAVLEAGLANLTVGVIPPALDQVLIGSLERSRNLDVKLALILGLNESLFPAPAPARALLTEPERQQLQRHVPDLGSTTRDHLARERFYAYIAFTRARERLVLSWAQQDSQGAVLNPSPFVSQFRQLFPTLPLEPEPATMPWERSEHACELVGPLLRLLPQDQSPVAMPMAALPELSAIWKKLKQFHTPDPDEELNPALAEALYGPVLRTSVSRIEQFAACPFRFFVHSGLRAEERKTFELDAREQGTFQHDVMAHFHQELQREGKRWRDLSPAEARERVARIAARLAAGYRDGLLETDEQTRFVTAVLAQALGDFVETLVEWMQQQYQFDPAGVELGFGEEGGAPGWKVPLAGGHALELHGRIDRIDLHRPEDAEHALCIVIDYKSSHRQLDPVLLANGIQLQLLGYLNVLLNWPKPLEILGVNHLVPAGVFYVNLRGKYEAESNRLVALAQVQAARRLAYRHTGRFDAQFLPLLDSRPGARQGDQFNYRLTSQGRIYKNSREAVETSDFAALLKSVEGNLKNVGGQIYAGMARVAPYRKGGTTACQHCTYQSICRIDPWTHRYRLLRLPQPSEQVSTT